MNFAEALSNVQNLRKAIEQQEKDFESGKTDKRPSVNQKTLDLTEKMIRNIYGDYSKGSATIKEALMSTDTVRLIPKVIEGQLREAAEPEYLASKFMNVIHVEGNNSAVYVVPVVGEIFASEVTEGGRYNEQNLDFNTVENGQLEIRVKKYGLKVTISEEAIQDSSWDIYGINVRKMGRAMARLKEENCFNAFSNHGHILFDNDKREQFPEAGTTGRDADGSYNDTLSVEDFLDLVLALMGNNRVPTDIIMHPLTWVIFARNSMIGNGLTFGAFGGNQVHPWGATQGTPGFAGLSSEEGPQKLIMRPDQVQNRLPVPLAINFSPFVRFDKLKKRFDMYCIDRSEVGVIVEREGLSTDDWNDPERDMRMLKVKERYGVGILDNGKGITVARNIAVAPTYPLAPEVRIQNLD
ncbi:phage major capsid protein [Megamonas rupellensis]|uniref:Phage major capsid protein, HK97 family n=2 Tax=Megamonas TaxID=158846 RepID=A0A378NTZ6_9FIRM|nr:MULTISPECIES: phage major capsid protein [Megamonas]RGQ08359.1 phage major capsid protein [Megamonas rupellensis]STY71285.1 phage major capsid protein, HK97 family [Megamonas hypermegale]